MHLNADTLRPRGATHTLGVWSVYMARAHKTNKRQAGAETATPVVNADTAQTTTVPYSIPGVCT